tara:strand:- start:160 stop:300 length:141 start_codon:yes stop_codon:yes gene_type:complete
MSRRRAGCQIAKFNNVDLAVLATAYGTACGDALAAAAARASVRIAY